MGKEKLRRVLVSKGVPNDAVDLCGVFFGIADRRTGPNMRTVLSSRSRWQEFLFTPQVPMPKVLDLEEH